METSIHYQNHVEIAKGLNLNKREDDNGFIHEKFEDLYDKAQDTNISLANAKGFITELTDNERRILEAYAGGGQAISMDELSDEGAYNLLMHSYEKYDFDEDGYVTTGNSKMTAMIPKNMDDDVKKAFVQTLNTEEGNVKGSVALAILGMDLDRMNYEVAQHMSEMSESDLQSFSDNASFNVAKFIEDTLDEPYVAEQITHEKILEKMAVLLADNNDASPEFREAMKTIYERFEGEYNKVKIAEIEKYNKSVEVNKLALKYTYSESEIEAKTNLEILLQG